MPRKRNSMPTRFIAFILIVFVFCYCKKPTKFKEIDVNNLYSLQIPAYLNSTDKLLPFTASNIQQYQDSVGKICLLVFDTSRIGIGSLKTFYDSMVANPVLDSVKITPPQFSKVDNDSVYRSEIIGMHNSIKVFGEIETIATKGRYFYLFNWSSLDRREQLITDMNTVLTSFHDLSHQKK